ncbi:MAG: IS1595 family transposase [Treponema sp.]|nr:IS1595 family transposase [Treponema sp.]
MTFIQFQNNFPTQKSIINYFISIRFPNGLICPKCGSDKISSHKSNTKFFNCNDCHNTFSIFTGTIFEKSSVDLRKWFYAINLVLNAKKGISAMQLQREIGVTYKTAWRILNKIRTAMGKENLNDSFEYVVEVDETYVGGKPRRYSKNAYNLKKGRGTAKTPVIGVKDRTTGHVYAKVAYEDYNGKMLTGKQLLSVIETVTKSEAVVLTDDFNGYNIMNHDETNPKNYIHLTVNHSKGQYSAGNGIHTNGIEGFWAIIKRSIIGSYHHVSVKYLQDYVNECCFRQNNKNCDAFEKLIKLA